MQEKNPEQNRQFVCSCGKNYLSYAALFTHIKQKHDGKAPGPIIRPRSERKRGRPRKNPTMQTEVDKIQDDDESEEQDNLAYKSQDIYNENNQFKQDQQQKAKKSSQVLGSSGGLAAFTAYKPDNGSALKNQKSISKKTSKKFSKISMKQSLCASENQNHPNFYKMNSTIKSQFLKIFQGQTRQSKKKLSLILQNNKFLQMILQREDSHQKDYDFQEISMKNGFFCFLKEIKQILSVDEELKFQDFDENHSKYSHIEATNYDQVLVLICLILDCYQEIENQSDVDALLSHPMVKLLESFQDMYFQALRNKISKLSLQEFQLFENNNPFKLMIYIYNWIAIKINESSHDAINNSQSKICSPVSDKKAYDEQKFEKEDKSESQNFNSGHPEIKEFQQNH